MKFVTKAIVASGLLALSACGGGAEENAAVNDAAADDLYNVAPDDLSLDNSLGNGLDDGLSNGLDNGLGNAADAGNEVDLNASGNSQ